MPNPYRTSGIIQSSTARQHTGGAATESQPADMAQGFWARIADVLTASDGVLPSVPYAQWSEVIPRLNADGTLGWEYPLDYDRNYIGRRSGRSTGPTPRHENILILDNWHNSPDGIKSTFPDMGTILWVEEFGYWAYDDDPDLPPTKAFSASITDLVWLEPIQSLTPETDRVEAWVLWRNINTALEQFVPDHNAELIRTPAKVYITDPLHETVLIGADDSQTTDGRGQFVLCRYSPSAGAFEPIRVEQQIRRIMLAEDHPGHAQIFKGHLGEWCASSSSWVYDCGASCDDLVWCIDYFYGGGNFIYPEDGATGPFVPRESWQYGIIWTALSGDCASPGPCDNPDRSGPCSKTQEDITYTGICPPPPSP